MHYVHRMTLMIHTASCDNFLESQGIPSYYEALLRNLSRQSLREFELVYVDSFYEENREKFDRLLSGLNFIAKHVPIHKDHRYWFDKGYCYIAAAKNTGILHADGELLVTCDDGEFFPDDFLQRCWSHYKSGHYMLGMHNRLKSIKTENGIPVFPIQGEIYINDNRFNQLYINASPSSKSNNIFQHNNGSWAYAGTSFSLLDALELNGFNERMDGCKSLDDCDFGNRLQILGRKFVQDKKGIFYILDHPSYADMTPANWEVGLDGQSNQLPPPTRRKKIDNLIAVENYGTLRCSVELKEIKANVKPLTDNHLNIIQRETIHYRKFDPLAPENAEKFSIWKGVPTFDLVKQRQELRTSKEWRW